MGKLNKQKEEMYLNDTSLLFKTLLYDYIILIAIGLVEILIYIHFTLVDRQKSVG